jgi:hemerythrin-like metal-binding protein
LPPGFSCTFRFCGSPSGLMSGLECRPCLATRLQRNKQKTERQIERITNGSAVDPVLSVSNKTNDDQLLVLIRRIAAFQESKSQEKGRNEIKPIVELLNDYVQKHFVDEERRMRDANYTGYLSHKAAYGRFTRTFAAIQVEVERDGAAHTLTLKVQRELVDWLVSPTSAKLTRRWRTGFARNNRRDRNWKATALRMGRHCVPGRFLTILFVSITYAN